MSLEVPVWFEANGMLVSACMAAFYLRIEVVLNLGVLAPQKSDEAETGNLLKSARNLSSRFLSLQSQLPACARAALALGVSPSSCTERTSSKGRRSKLPLLFKSRE